MEEDQIVEDVDASPLSEAQIIVKSSMQRELNTNEAMNLTFYHIPHNISQSKKGLFDASPLSESSPLSEAPIVVDLKASLQRELNTLWANTDEAKKFTIFRTPHNISQSKKDLFEPSVISIGPFHHGQKHLQTLEDQKRRFLQDFLSCQGHISLELCISEMELLETSTRKCYSDKFDNLDSKAFVQMMLLDGCFLLEYFLRTIQEASCPVLRVEVGWNSHFIVCDLRLLENQIPFFIVDKLCELIGYKKDARRIFVKYIAYALLPIESIIPDLSAEIPNPLDKIPEPPAEIHHLAHLCYHYLVLNRIPDESTPSDLTRMFSANRIKGFLHRFLSRVLKRISCHSTSTTNLSSMVIPSATELKEAGLKFTQKSKPRNMLDISFKNGVLEIPRLKIQDDTKHIFANLLAFEHSKCDKKNSPFGRFVHFLDCLVNTPNDVTILQQCGIIENLLGSGEELAHFLNRVTKGNVLTSDHYLVELYTEVNRYMESSWHKHRAKLVRDYFSSPWTAISLVAALILLVLTCVQTFYAVYAYKFPPSS